MKFQAVRSLRNNINRLDLNRATEKAMKAREEDISELNRDQLRQGQRSDGTFLPPYSSNSVSKFGKTPGPIKLFETGDFYKGIKPEFKKEEFNITDLDNKTDMLQDRYGESILGLSNLSIGELAQDSLGQIQYELRQQL